MSLRFGGRALEASARLRDGTHRAASLDATWTRFAPARRKAGITRIADLTGLDTLGIPVFAAIRPMGLSLSTQQGKGITADAARVSALMESLETWTAEHVALPVVRGSYRKLRARAVDVRELPRPRGRLDLDATWSWVEGVDLLRDEPVLVPLQAVTLDTTFTRPPVFDISSNGLASGNVLVEAIVHGLAEVIERDAEAAWRRAGGDRRIVLDTIADPMCQALLDQISATGARVFVWDLASDTGVPVIGCAIMEDPREPAWRTLGFYQGFGAHLVPEIAIARAITEAAQTRLTYIAGARDDFFGFDYARATDPELLADIWDRLAGPCEEPASFDDLPRATPASLGHALELLVERIAGPVIAVDLTHPELRVPVVKVIAPGRAVDIEAMG
ncbi:MAG: YcaO-like family protein [Deltaproteobacteria bacterium]|nr:YcaO-like family protein [Deltaproteobacteria bacterium]MDQ3299037.1 YcaO-like family protein [Myxococcota bacterium]